MSLFLVFSTNNMTGSELCGGNDTDAVQFNAIKCSILMGLREIVCSC